MKKALTAFAAILSCLVSWTQPGPDLVTPGKFVIKGKLANCPQPFLLVIVTGLFDVEEVNIPLQPDGSFINSFSIINTQDIFILHDSIYFRLFAQPGDTLEVSWDDRNVSSSLSVRASTPVRQKELDLMIALTNISRTESNKLSRELYDEHVPDSVKYSLVKQQFASQVKTALTYPLTRNSRRIFCDIYYNHIELLKNAKIFDTYNLSFADVMPEKVADSIGVSSMFFQTVDDTMIYYSHNYRYFIFEYTRSHNPSYRFRTTGDDPPNPKFNKVLKDCYYGVAAFYSAPKVLDWYLTRTIMLGFGSHFPERDYTFEGAGEAYRQFYATIRNPFFRDTLQRSYNRMLRLQPGSAAPGFTLKNAAGKNVSLSDFKNKIVYIDFWGVHCGPCLYEIKNHASKLYEKYKDKDVVFVNICVDVREKEWKESCKQLNLHGINLLAEGWVSNTVCKDYNISSIPHYFLIDKTGKIVNNDAARPSQLLSQPINEIDKLLQ